MRPVVYSFSDSFSHDEIIGKSVGTKEKRKKRKKQKEKEEEKRDREREGRERTKGKLSHTQRLFQCFRAY